MISFLIPCHNYDRFLNKCLSSILNNNSKYIKEIIIVNDSSTDNTDQIVKYFKLKSKKIFFFKKKFRNLAKTMNFAIKKTKGEILKKNILNLNTNKLVRA